MKGKARLEPGNPKSEARNPNQIQTSEKATFDADFPPACRLQPARSKLSKSLVAQTPRNQARSHTAGSNDQGPDCDDRLMAVMRIV
jgi:hypothetical protein